MRIVVLSFVEKFTRSLSSCLCLLSYHYISYKTNSPNRASSKGVSGYIKILLDCGKEFSLDRDLLNFTSEYFAAIFRNQNLWIESNSSNIQLLDINERVCAVFREWLETDSITSTQPISRTSNQMHHSGDAPSTLQTPISAPGLVDIVGSNKDDLFETQISDRLNFLIECYMLGDYLKVPVF